MRYYHIIVWGRLLTKYFDHNSALASICRSIMGREVVWGRLLHSLDFHLSFYCLRLLIFSKGSANGKVSLKENLHLNFITSPVVLRPLGAVVGLGSHLSHAHSSSATEHLLLDDLRLLQHSQRSGHEGLMKISSENSIAHTCNTQPTAGCSRSGR